ncbi:Os03g0731050, partial [Oryza sativa Japonica Group]
VYVHALPSYRANFTTDSVFYRRQIPSKVAEWGEMTMCDAERRLLANALLDISNEWFVLVSESCIPIFNFNTTYRYLQNSSQSFVMAFDDPGPYGRGRYNWNMTPEVELTQWRKGSQWFEVNRELAIEIVRDTLYYPKFKEFCRPHCYVDEHYFPTMLTIEAPQSLANRSITWVDWSRGGAHPATFGRGDITEEFLRRVQEGRTCLYNGQNSTMCFLFARKFAPSALEPLLELAPTVLGFG